MEDLTGSTVWERSDSAEKATGYIPRGTSVSSGSPPDVHQPARAGAEVAHFEHDSETVSCVEGFGEQVGGNSREATVAVA